MNGPVQPDFVTYDAKEREALLSQVGNLTPAERELFHRLSKMWAPEINYNTFFAMVSADSVSAKNDIDSMMRKLRTARLGLMTSSIKDGVRLPLSIVISNPDDYYFYHKVVEEELMEVVADISLPLPSQQGLTEKNINLPPQFITLTEFKDLADLYNQKEVKDHMIIRVDVRNVQLLMTSQTIKRFMTVALAKFKTYLQNSNFLSFLAQLKNMSLVDLKKNIDSHEPQFLVQLTKEISEHQDEIRQNRKINVDDAFWAVIMFLHHFLTNQIEETKRRKAAEEERALDMRSIAEQIKAEPLFLMTEDKFIELLLSYKKKYDKGFMDFKKDFEDKYLQAPERKALPTLVHLSRYYLHQDNLHAFFLLSLEKNSKELIGVYVHLMERYIKNPANSVITAFYTPDNFQNDIADHIKELDHLMHALLQRPSMVAEGIILSIRKHKETKTAEELKIALGPFFLGDRLQFRENSVLFDLNIITIFKLAFLKLSIIRQLVLKISGKFESLYKKFDEFVETTFSDEILREKKLKKADDSEERLGHGERKQSDPEDGATRRKRLSGGSSKESAPSPPPVPKKYSKDERDGAWQNFGKTLKK